jgi:hypothetical protein
MNRLSLKWWHWLLVGSGFCVVAVISGPMADRHGYGTLASLIVSIFAWIGFSICWIVGFLRLVKWVWSLRSSNSS